jgi:S1-C subfamily serine protease
VSSKQGQGAPFTENQIYIAAHSRSDRAPDRIFRARIVASDSDLDFAVLQLVATETGGALPGNLGLVAIPVGDSDTVKQRDTIEVIGFPGIVAGRVIGVVVTKGIISAIVAESPYGDKAWFLIDAQVNPGNSGGMAVKEGKLIGVPTGRTKEELRKYGDFGLVRSINLSKQLIAKAREVTGWNP